MSGPSAGPVTIPLWTRPTPKRLFIHRLFSEIAPRYDWFNRLASCGLDQRWRREALRRGTVERGMRLLDVCTGTGDLALLAAAVQQGQGEVVGLDMNGAMLGAARRKEQRRGRAVTWVRGDAQALPFRDGSFDRVLMGFSTRNLNDLMAGLGEMVRALRPHGRLIILETGRPANPIVRLGYLVFLFTGARAIGFLLTGRWWPFTYLARSVRGFLTPHEVVARLQGLGAQVEYVSLSGGLASLYLATKTS